MGEMLLNGRLYGASGIRELTQAQYDALPVSKLTDGVLYCIKDTGIIEGDKYTPVIYSLEEREIGVWIDGKPLYQKTIVLPISDFSTTTDGYVLHGIDNIDFPVYAYGFPYDENLNYGQEIVPASATLSNTGINAQWSTAVTYFNRTRLGYFLGSEMLSRLSHFYFTLQYTKTTDVPGSGTWGTDGVPMVHYDGNEKIIGTWFGETLYEKTFELSTSISVGSSWVNTGLTLMNVKYLIHCSGGRGLAVYNVMADMNGNNIELCIPGWSASIKYFTIQYTKTS